MSKRTGSVTIRLLQWNILADGLADDGFLSTEFGPIAETAGPDSAIFSIDHFLNLVRAAKQDDTRNGVIAQMERQKYLQKRLQSLPKSASDEYQRTQQEFDKLEKELKKKSKLIQIKHKFRNSPQLQQVKQSLLSWAVRYDRIKRILLEASPDIITFQEMDHLQDFLEDPDIAKVYTSFLGDTVSYRPADLESCTAFGYLEYVLRRQVAFCPKSSSNARKLRTKRIQTGWQTSPKRKRTNAIDDDGVAILWKKKVFSAVEFTVLHNPNENHVVMAITLEHCAKNLRLHVLTTHLPSGDNPKKELERLAVLKEDPKQRNAKSRWKAGRIRAITQWKFEPLALNFDGILSFVRYFVDLCNDSSRDRVEERVIFALDTNSRPRFPEQSYPVLGESMNVWQAILQIESLQSVWVQSSCLDVDGLSQDPKHPYVVSVNKMRGPSSAQPAKIGEHQLELIDHCFTNAKSCRIVKKLQLGPNSAVTVAPKLYASKEGKAELELNPTTTMPSDHLPVLVDLEF